MATPSPTRRIKDVFARRGIGSHGEPVTFLSWDRADNDSAGWSKGHFDDGAIIPGCFNSEVYRLTHVMEPSWRVRAPLASPAQAKAA